MFVVKNAAWWRSPQFHSTGGVMQVPRLQCYCVCCWQQHCHCHLHLQPQRHHSLWSHVRVRVSAQATTPLCTTRLVVVEMAVGVTRTLHLTVMTSTKGDTTHVAPPTSTRKVTTQITHAVMCNHPRAHSLVDVLLSQHPL